MFYPKAYLVAIPKVNGGDGLFECPNCKGIISRYYAELMVCHDCKKVLNLADLLNLLKKLGVHEQNIRRIQDNLTYPKLFAA